MAYALVIVASWFGIKASFDEMTYDLIDYDCLDAQERFKDSDPMEQMVELIREYDGLTIYRMR